MSQQLTARKDNLIVGNVDLLLSQAIEKGVTVDVMERLVALREHMLAKEAERAFNEAMAAFQAECPVIEKRKTVENANGKVIYRYAPLDSIISQVKHLIEKHGFSYSFKTKTGEGNITVVCHVKHALGHFDESDVQVPTNGGTSIMSGPQKVAAALTFAKRYAFCDIFGIMTGDEDNDAAPQKPIPKPPRKIVKPTQTQVMEYMTNAETTEKLDQVLDHALKYQWTDAERAAITECFDNSLAKFLP